MPRKELVGEVISNKMDRTVTVAVQNHTSHPKYEKVIAQTNKFKAHDENNSCQIGDVVRIRECRPLSKTKRWLVIDTVGHAESAVEQEEK
ncbi:MAG: 30S ribosomal protein S17 [Candidatus Obscuribacterales bacterium]|nr:30S ribosomal protein S17 [Candidatus Obscuribacterales bacterium]